jgi:hypothetical protein
MQLKTGSGSGSSAVFESRYDSRTQTEGPSSYGYSLSTTMRQADTKSTGTWKATDTTSRCTSNESSEGYV